MRIAMKILFSKTERFLIRNNRKFVINSSENTSTDSDSTDKDFSENSIKQGFDTRFKQLLKDTDLLDASKLA